MYYQSTYIGHNRDSCQNKQHFRICKSVENITSDKNSNVPVHWFQHIIHCQKGQQKYQEG